MSVILVLTLVGLSGVLAIPRQELVPEPRPLHVIDTPVVQVQPEPKQSCAASHTFQKLGEAIAINSPGYPGSYPNNMNCVYTIKSPANTAIRMDCNEFNVEEETNCGYDVFYFSLTGSPYFTDKVVTCGRGTFSQTSKTNAITIGFKSDESNPRSTIPFNFKCSLTVVSGSSTATTTTSRPLAPVTAPAPSGQCSCGTRNEAMRIVNGTESLVNEFPWRVGLYQGQGIFCGGTIISPNYVLTAAHCTHGLQAGSTLYVDVADHDLTSLSESKNEVVKVTKIIPHPAYNSKTQDNDVVLLKLEKPLDFSRREIQPACLPWNFPSKDYKGESIVASGWGTTSSGGSQPSKLMKVDLPILTTEQCRQYYGTTAITNNMICTYLPGKDTCQGDSGGSIDWKNPTNSNYYCIGVVSWGVGCAGERNPGVYAKVGNYLEWIVANTQGESFCQI